MDAEQKYTIIQRTWYRSSADFSGEPSYRTTEVSADTTVDEIIRWSLSGDALCRGDIILAQQDLMAAPTSGGAKREDAR